MIAFKDNFSGVAADYARYRPSYPPELFEYLASLPERRDLAWDCGTGNGQAAMELARHFGRIIATDPSEKQIAQAPTHERVEYRVAPAEKTDIEARSVDLITVAQALHWFDVDAFYAEARRVLRPGCVLAVWCYTLHRITSEIDNIVHIFYTDIVGPYWPPERSFVDEQYRSIPKIFGEEKTPSFTMRARWALGDLLGYLNTWSATQKYIQRRGHHPVDEVRGELTRAWGEPELERDVTWPIHLRVGRVPTSMD